jgi:hypothetical protein
VGLWAGMWCRGLQIKYVASSKGSELMVGKVLKGLIPGGEDGKPTRNAESSSCSFSVDCLESHRVFGAECTEVASRTTKILRKRRPYKGSSPPGLRADVREKPS